MFHMHRVKHLADQYGVYPVMLKASFAPNETPPLSLKFGSFLGSRGGGTSSSLEKEVAQGDSIRQVE